MDFGYFLVRSALFASVVVFTLPCGSLGLLKNDSLVKIVKRSDTLHCESPEPFPNGQFVHQPIRRSSSPATPLDSDTLYLEGSRLDYSCNMGYTLIGSTTLICEKSGLWSAKPPVCRRNCPRIDSPKFGSVRCVSESEQHPKCKLLENLGLSKRVPRQINSAPCPPKDDRSSFLFTTCTGRCLSGYYFTSGMENEMILTCRGGVWTPRTSFPDCQSPKPLAYCPYPGDIANGRVYISTLNEKRRPFDESEEEYPEGSRLQYSCLDGFVLKGSTSLSCTNLSTWSAAPPACIPAPRPLTYCQYPGGIINGRVVHFPKQNERRRPNYKIEDDYPEGSRLKYSCNEGYTLEGTSIVTCQNTGSWTSGPPTCKIDVLTEIMSCKKPELISNGWAEYVPPPTNQRRDPIAGEYPEHSILVYSCEEGYRLQGHESVTCQPTGSWSRDIPSCVPDCGRSFIQTHNRLVNGSKTIAGDWPWVVSLSVEINGKNIFICGGAILNTHFVITAAHCLTDPLVLGKRLILHFGKHNFGVQEDDDDVLERKSSRVIIHPRYSNKTFDSDIALVFFKPRIRYSVLVQPLCLPTWESTSQNIEPGRIGYVSGWGLTKDEVSPDVMMLASLPVISNGQCMDAYKEKNLVMTSNMFCAGYDDGRQSVCSGDSGSPFVFYDKNIKRYILEGLVSFSERGQCGVAGKYAIFTKVFKFLNWIIRLYNIRN